MEIAGKVVQKLQEESGTSKNGNQWRKQSIVIETESQYPKKICFTLWGDKIDEANLTEGDMISAKVDIESREYNGRWYTDVKAWQVQKAGENSVRDEYNQEPDVSSFGDQEGSDDLPF
ncbi:MAG: DUF3127 domain-containing protein [Cytophagales bacterium]